MLRTPSPVLFTLFIQQGTYVLALVCVAATRWGIAAALLVLAVCMGIIFLGSVWLTVICRLHHNPTPWAASCGMAIGVCVAATIVGVRREFRLAALSGGDVALRLEAEKVLPLQRLALFLLLCTLAAACLGWFPLARWAARPPPEPLPGAEEPKRPEPPLH